MINETFNEKKMSGFLYRIIIFNKMITSVNIYRQTISAAYCVVNIVL